MNSIPGPIVTIVIVAIITFKLPACRLAEPAPDRQIRPLPWAETIEPAPDPSIIRDPTLQKAIANTHLPWRVRDRQSGVEMVLVPAGVLRDSRRAGWLSAPENARPIINNSSFYLARGKVTKNEWFRLLGTTCQPIGRDGAKVMISWNDIQDWLAHSPGLRVPSETEWEYAYHCGARLPQARIFDATMESVCPAGRWPVNTGESNINILGFFDLADGPWEWCDTCYIDDPAAVPNNFKVLRGFDSGIDSRSAAPPGERNGLISFRVARNP
ncbi:MAG: SUMF1/EgtB/PvdO family nonheme iron enzyme [Planctomycetes bacterium]|nr:SUMF1/EgtB/PvdO family nonheme iron enzyme [Planctomycetota bacterium]